MTLTPPKAGEMATWNYILTAAVSFFCVIKVVLRSTVYRYENNCLRCDSPTLKKLTTFSKTRIIGRENNLPSPIFAFVAGLRPPSLDYRKAALVYRPATQF